MKRRPCWCSKQILWELDSFLMQKMSFVLVNLHICWPREWICSLQPTLRESNCVLPCGVTQIFLQDVTLPRQMSRLFFFLCSSQLEYDHINMFSRQYAVIYLYFSYKLIFHTWSLVKQFFHPFIRCPWILSRQSWADYAVSIPQNWRISGIQGNRQCHPVLLTTGEFLGKKHFI